ncbi:MAG: RNase HII [Erysipelotrichaceae bacterium]|nr:MAG: RNase [Erysipelotrichaceae bacterium]TXT19420.1 MAG: RNase HII [Erysipelotrichaceae bacterium]
MAWLEADFNKFKRILGIDEAGRGPLAGPCVVAGVILPKGFSHPLINDSKKLSEKQRNACFKDIVLSALWVGVIEVLPETIDRRNIYQATKDANIHLIQLANADVCLTDAMPISHQRIPVYDYIKGDSRSISIAAASIIAKVCRDAIMVNYDQMYPNYGFKQHKGYPTKAHIEALNTYGITPIHRLSYEPVAKLKRKTFFDGDL